MAVLRPATLKTFDPWFRLKGMNFRASLVETVECWRLTLDANQALQRARSLGLASRPWFSLKLLARYVALLDALAPGPRDCFRRVLLAVALDPSAAASEVVFGLRRPFGPKTGHAWLTILETPDRRQFDAVVCL